ncbi:MAG TPA: glycosyltransferase family 1 protein [Bacteroidia bacterium]|nr:glycosyltransferase family 1 protein [Bacteroidia bacterium]
MAVKRKKIGIIFSIDENWIGGTYYFLNLVSSFTLLPDKEKPFVAIFAWHKKEFDLVKETKYPYLKFLNLNIHYSYYERLLNKISRAFGKGNIIDKSYSDKDVDVIYPYKIDTLKKISNNVYWIPDFQEYYLPMFFSKEEIITRKKACQKIAEQKTKLILSSQSAQNDFNTFYPTAICETKVVNFAVTHPPYQHLEIELLKKKYNIKGSYFFAPNQLWKHKNQLIILKAIKLVKEKKENILVVFTGKEYDNRNPTYTDELKEFVKSNGLEKNALFLGFIDRAEQLQLMNHSHAVIQPSLFEGWSTVVEDVKAMNQFVIASDIPVHREQLINNSVFFNPTDEYKLADILLLLNKKEIEKIQNNYQLNIKNFAEQFISAIK